MSFGIQPTSKEHVSGLLDSTTTSNALLARAAVQLCLNSGIEHFVVCAGARNAPFVKLLSASKKLSVSYFYDERAAGFFALGRAKRAQRPVAVVTTSGTAVAELLPAVIEAFYSGHPLVLITSDRPKNFRGTGSPQSINQSHIFGEYAYPTLDLDQASDCPKKWLLWENNLHINACFTEPLLDAEVIPLEPKEHQNFQSLRATVMDSWSGDITSVKKPIFVISTLNAKERDYVSDIFTRWPSSSRLSIYVEATSGLQGSALINEKNILNSQDLKNIKYPEDFDSVIRIGGVPTIRFWRDLEIKFKNVPVLSFSRLSFSGLGRLTDGVFPIEELETLLTEFSDQKIPEKSWVMPKTLTRDISTNDRTLELVKKYPRSEPALLWAYIQTLKCNDEIFVGNSLPIRELDLFTTHLSKDIAVTANRGVNGIDGLISTAQGFACSHKNMHVILGDLSALYDMNALSQDKYTEAKEFNVVVINNHGGKIFKRMFQDAHFENQHEWRFKNWAEMFGFAYYAVPKSSDLQGLTQKKQKAIIELLPEAEETDLFWQEYEKK